LSAPEAGSETTKFPGVPNRLVRIAIHATLYGIVCFRSSPSP
jgi:hypothetical protein